MSGFLLVFSVSTFCTNCRGDACSHFYQDLHVDSALRLVMYNLIERE